MMLLPHPRYPRSRTRTTERRRRRKTQLPRLDQLHNLLIPPPVLLVRRTPHSDENRVLRELPPARLVQQANVFPVDDLDEAAGGDVPDFDGLFGEEEDVWAL